MPKNCDQPRKEPPKCPKCKWAAMHPVTGRPPEPSVATCKSCGHRWNVCGAHPDAVAGPCFQRPKKGIKRCDAHGNELSGAPIQHGGRAGFYEKLGLGDRIDAIRNDPQLGSHRENIILLEGLLLREGDDATPPAELWARALELYDEAVTKREVGSMKELGEVLRKGAAEADRTERIIDLAEQQRKHKESEAKREAALDQGLTSRQAFGLLGTVVAVVTEEVESAFAAVRRGEEVTSHYVLGRIGDRIRRLVARAPSGSTDSPGIGPSEPGG